MTSREDQEAVAATVLVGGGEMGALMRSMDWVATPLGPMASWPRHLRTAVNICLGSRFPMVIWWGPELILLYNDAWRPVMGATKHPRALGSPGREIWPEIWDVIGPMFERVLATGDATWSEDQLLLVNRYGYTEEAYFTFSYSPIRDENGAVDGVFTAVTETTIRVLGERRLRLLRELATRTAEARGVENACARALDALRTNPADIPFALLYLLDDAGREARLAGTIGLAPDTALSPCIVALAEGEEQPTPWPLADVARTGQAARVDDLGAWFDPPNAAIPPPRTALALPIAQAGQERLVGVLIAGVNPRRTLDDDYRGFYTLVAGQIATATADARAYEEERRRAETLAELDRAKTAFFNNVSHEFRTPLTLMLGPLEDVLAAPEDAALVREQVAAAHRNSLRLLRLVNTLLDFSRVEGARMEATYEPADLAALTADLASAFRAAIECAGLRFVVDCPPLPEPVYVDHDMWERIVLNLLSNAFKFTLEGEISVTLGVNGDQVVLEVRDTGRGIPAEELPHLFERFHRVRGARARTHEGTGIGLALTRDLVGLHGGTIGAQSVEGVGTTFTVTLPLGLAHLPSERIQAARTQASTALGAAPYVEEALRWLPTTAATDRAPAREVIADVPAAATAPLTAAAGGATPRARVLLADDNADLRDYLTRLLAARYDVQAVSNGAQALEAARQWPPDLVLSDVMMPELDGFELLRELRADPRTSAIPVVLLSARAGEESTVEGLQAGADDYLVKPFSARELLARVQTHVELSRLRARTAEMERAWRAEAEQAGAVIAAERDRLQAEVTARARVEEALRTNRAHLQLALTSARMVAWEWDPTADAIVTTENLADIYGISRLDASTQGFALVHPDDVARHETTVAEAVTTGRSYQSTFRIIRPDTGEVVWLEERGVAVLDGAGALSKLTGVVMDVSARARAEAELRQQGALLALAHDAIIVRDPRGGILAWNKGAADLYGWTDAEALGQSTHDLLRTRLLASGSPGAEVDTLLAARGVWEGELQHIRRDETPLVVESRQSLLRAADGTPEAILEVNRDITARTRADEERSQLLDAAEAERDRWRQVLDVLPVGVVIVDARGRVEVLNQSGRDIVGHDTRGQPLPSPDEEDKEDYRVRRPDGTPYPPREVPLRRSLLYGEEVRGDQELHRHAVTGRETPLLVNSAPLRDAAGAIVGAVAVFQDITPLKDLEHAREEFLSSAAHDLKTPLTSMRGHAQLARRRLARLVTPDAAPVSGHLAQIDTDISRLLNLINELADVTRVQMGQALPLDRQPTDLLALARGVVAQQEGLSAHRLRLDTALATLEGLVDPARVERVVANLLSNAVKYSPEGGEITMYVAREEGPAGPEAVIAVQDQGIGVPAADLPHIFERFHRARNVVGQAPGTGIGLASARQIVAEHGGTISVESQESSGSTFTVRLPLTTPPEGGTEA